MSELDQYQHSDGTVVEESAPTVADVMPMNYSAIDSLPEKSSVKNIQNSSGVKKPIEFLYDIPIQLVFEVGRIDISIKQLMELKEGSMIDLRQVSVDSIDIRINNEIFGYGEAIGLLQSYGIRFGELEIFSKFDDSAGMGQGNQS